MLVLSCVALPCATPKPCAKVQAFVLSQGGVGSTNFMKKANAITTNNLYDADGIKHLFPFNFTFDTNVTVSTAQVPCVTARHALVIVGEVHHAAYSVVRRFGTKHVNKLRAQLGWPQLSKSQVNGLGAGVPAASGMYEFKQAWQLVHGRVSSRLLRVATTQQVYKNETEYLGWLRS